MKNLSVVVGRFQSGTRPGGPGTPINENEWDSVGDRPERSPIFEAGGNDDRIYLVQTDSVGVRPTDCQTEWVAGWLIASGEM